MDPGLPPDAQERFTRCWTLSQPAVAGYINALVPNLHEAEDLLQNVAVVLLRKFAAYDQQQPFVAWAIGIARYEILAKRRDFARSRTVFTPDLIEQAAADYTEMLPELDARQHALRDCLTGVGARATEVLRLRYQEALEPRDIATRLGMSAVAIRVMLNRVRAVLHTCIERRLSVADERP